MPMPTKPKDEKFVSTSLTLHPETLERLRARAKPGEPISAMLRTIIKEWLDKTEPGPDEDDMNQKT